jgi:hypothetical protein
MFEGICKGGGKTLIHAFKAFKIHQFNTYGLVHAYVDHWVTLLNNIIKYTGDRTRRILLLK